MSYSWCRGWNLGVGVRIVYKIFVLGIVAVAPRWGIPGFFCGGGGPTGGVFALSHKHRDIPVN
jgi:hypothetical protein